MKRRLEVEEVFRREMLKLRSEYIEHCFGQIEIMQTLLLEHKGAYLTPESVKQLKSIAYRLHGSGRTYDLPQLTEGAQHLIDELKAIEDDAFDLTPKQKRMMLAYIEKLLMILKSARESGSPFASQKEP